MSIESNNESREMTDEELEKIVGGVIPTGGRMQQQHNKPGLPCPICGQLIPISINQLLFDRALFCTSCGLRLSIDKQKTEKAQEILAKVEGAISRLDK